MRILVLGCEEVGVQLIPVLAGEGHHVTVIDPDPKKVEEVADRPNVEIYLSTEPLMDDLRQAGVSNADVFLALSDNDNRNAMAAQVAQQVFHVPKVICRIDDPHRQRVYEELDLKVVSSTMALVEAIHTAVGE